MVDIDVERFAINLGYSYLNGGYGKWEDGSGKVYELNSMPANYLKNCSNFVLKGIEEIESGNIDKEIAEKIKDEYSEIDFSNEDINDIKNSIIDILKSKKDEIDEV